MKVFSIALGLVVGLPVMALILLFVIGSVVGPKEKTEKTMPSSPSADAPIRDIPLPIVAPDPGGLQSPDTAVRQQAASRLGETANPADCDALLAALPNETDWTVRAAIMTGLGKQYQQSPAVRAKGSDRLLAPLVRELAAPETGRRVSAVRSLGWIKDRRAVGPLLRLLGDKDGSIRETTIQTLGVLGSTEAVPALLKIAQTKADTDSMERWPRIRATTALANIGDAQAVAPLIALLDDPDPTFRGATVRALGQLNDHRAAPALRQLLQNDPSDQVRFDVICALAALRDPGALPLLQTVASGKRIVVNGQSLPEVAERAIRFVQTGKGRVDEYNK